MVKCIIHSIKCANKVHADAEKPSIHKFNLMPARKYQFASDHPVFLNFGSMGSRFRKSFMIICIRGRASQNHNDD